MKSHLSSNCRRGGMKKLSSPRFTSWRVLILATKTKPKSTRIVDFLELNSPSIRQYPTLIKGQTKSDSTTLMRLSRLRTYSRVRWTWPGSMFSKNTSQNRLMTQQAFYCRSQTETLRKVLREPSNSSFSVVRMRRSFETGSWSTIILVAISRFERTLE